MSINERSPITNGVKRILSPREWSAVTSPGFSSRIVRAVEQDPPLREINSPGTGRSYTLLPFQMSPSRNLGIGQRPLSTTVWKPTPTTSPLRFSSPQSANRSVNMGYHRQEENIGRLFLKIAPLSEKVTPPALTPDGTGTENGAGLGHSGSVGLGGTRSPSITKKMSRMWPNANNAYEPPSPSSVSTPQIPSLAESLNRKRNSEQKLQMESSPVVSIPTPSASDEVKKNKKSRFLNTPDEAMSNSSLASVPLTSYHSNGNMTSESILEQMNQTEKRFLPDDDGTPVRPNAKRQKSSTGHSPSSSSRSLPNSSNNLFRKRKVSPRTFAVMDEEDVQSNREKAPRLCGCADCYREAAGTSLTKASVPSPSSTGTPTRSTSKVQRTSTPKTNDSLTQTPTQKKSEDVPDRLRNGGAEVTGKDFVTRTRDTLSPFALIDKEKYYNDEKAKKGRLYKILELSNDTPRSVTQQHTTRSLFMPQTASNSSTFPSSNAAAPISAALTYPSPILSSGLSSKTEPAGIPNQSFVPNQSVAPTVTVTSSSMPVSSAVPFPSFGTSPVAVASVNGTQTLPTKSPTPTPTSTSQNGNIGNPAITSGGFQFGTKPISSQQISGFGSLGTPFQSSQAPTTTTQGTISTSNLVTETSSPSAAPAVVSSTPVSSTPVASTAPSKPLGTSPPFGGFGGAGTTPSLFGLTAGTGSPAPTPGFNVNGAPSALFQFGTTPSQPQIPGFGSIGTPQPSSQTPTTTTQPTMSNLSSLPTSSTPVVPVVTTSAPAPFVASSVPTKPLGTSSPSFGGFGGAGTAPSLFGMGSPSTTPGFNFNGTTPFGGTVPAPSVPAVTTSAPVSFVSSSDSSKPLGTSSQQPFGGFSGGTTPSVFGGLGAGTGTPSPTPGFNFNGTTPFSGTGSLPAPSVVTTSAPVPFVSSSVPSTTTGTSSQPFGGFGGTGAGTTPSPFGLPAGSTPSPFGLPAGSTPSPFGLPAGTGSPSPAPGFNFNGAPSTPFQFGSTSNPPQTQGFGSAGIFQQPLQTTTQVTTSNPNSISQFPSPSVVPSVTSSVPSPFVSSTVTSSQPFGGFGGAGGGTAPSPFGLSTGTTPSPFGLPAGTTPSPFGVTAGATSSPFALPAGTGSPSPNPGFNFNSTTTPFGGTLNPPAPTTPFQFGSTANVPQTPGQGYDGFGTPQQTPQMFTMSNASPSSATRRTQLRGRRYR